ncbi:MAG: UvrD-helicase domain-containing protein [Planctomycetaceae bacterium]
MTRSMPLTLEQQAILDAGWKAISVAVSAGAGCGKTFILTQRFLNFLQPTNGRADPLSRIVAITFTEKAGREMRHRVRAACQNELLHCEDECVNHWLGVLRGLDTARITTIHAYCATLLRTYAVEAGLDPGFGLIDPSFGDLLTQRSVQEGLCRQLETGDASAIDLVTRFGFERSVKLLRELLDGVRTADLERIESYTPKSLLAAWEEHWVEQCVPQLARELWESPTARSVVELLEANEPSHPKMQEGRALLLARLNDDPSNDPTVLDQIHEAAKVKGGAKAWGDPALYETVKEAFESFRKALKDFGKKCKVAADDGSEAATVALTVHGVARVVADEYARRKQEESQLDFDDLLCLTRNLLRDQAQVRRRAVAGIDLLMVDEFQDTDPVQAEVVRLLCGEALPAGKLFLVGDAKQSIYRFRGADPRVFATIREELPEEGCLPLTTNFRSQPAILRFVNETFSNEISDYEPLLPADLAQYSPEPCVEFLFAVSQDKAEKAEDRRRNEARWIAGRLAELLSDPTPRVLDAKTKTLRRVVPGDVAILFRTLSNVAFYEQALVDRGLEYFLAGGRAFFAQQETFDVAHLCRWLEDPGDELSLAGALRSPLFGLTDDTLFLLKPEKNSSIAAGLASPPKLPELQAAQVRSADRILTELRDKKDRLPLAELLTLAVERTGYDAALLCEHLGPRKLANLRKLIGLARSFDAAGPFTLSEFVVRLNDAVREQAAEELAITHPEVSDVLRLMTIHQSKGLEFPVVVLADMDWRRPGGDSRAVYHPELGPLFQLPDDGDGRPPHLGVLIHRLEEAREEQLEQTRLLYVALTRARDHLILSAGLEHGAKPRSPWMKLLARRFDLSTGLPLLDPYFGSANGNASAPQSVSKIRVHHKEPRPPEPASKSTGDPSALPRFRELVSETPPEPLPELIGVMSADTARRSEFTVTELCKIDQRARRDFAGDAADSLEQAAAHPDGIAGTSEYARIIGTVSHAVLERIDFSESAVQRTRSLAELVDRCLLSSQGVTHPEIHRRVLNAVDTLLDSPLCEELAQAERLYREVEFRLRWDRPEVDRPAELVGTIDCLYRDRTGDWHVLDYKAVADANQSETSIVNRYRLQLAIYAIAVQRLFGRLPVSARLVRLGPPMRLYDVPLTSESLAEASARIDAAITALREKELPPELPVDRQTAGD